MKNAPLPFVDVTLNIFVFALAVHSSIVPGLKNNQWSYGQNLNVIMPGWSKKIIILV